MEEGEVVVGFAVAAGGDAAFGFEPGVGAFDWEAVFGLWVGCAEPSCLSAQDLACWCSGRDRLALAAWLADPRLDRALVEGLLDFFGGVAAVGPQLSWSYPLREQRVDER